MMRSWSRGIRASQQRDGLYREIEAQPARQGAVIDQYEGRVARTLLAGRTFLEDPLIRQVHQHRNLLTRYPAVSQDLLQALLDGQHR